MKRLLLITHRPIEQAGGPAARWRAFTRYLPEHGWNVEVLSAPVHVGAAEFDAAASRAVAARAATMTRLGRLSKPMFGLVGVRPDALPLSTLWIARGAALARRRTTHGAPDVVVATGPPIAGLIAARLGVCARVPLILELRDLWAANPAFDAGGRLLSAIERWLLREAQRVVVCTPEAVSDLRLRHPMLDGRIVEIPNGFDPEIAGFAPDASAGDRALPRRISLLHSGTLVPARPLLPLVRALEDRRVAGGFELVLHGHLAPASRAEVELVRRESKVPVEIVAPSSWPDAVRRIARADAGLILQARAAGDETAVASKVYEYLALGRPTLCVTDGGASETLLRRLGADQLCARLDKHETIVAALMRLRKGAFRPPAPERLAAYSRRELARRMAALLDDVTRGG